MVSGVVGVLSDREREKQETKLRDGAAGRDGDDEGRAREMEMWKKEQKERQYDKTQNSRDE